MAVNAAGKLVKLVELKYVFGYDYFDDTTRLDETALSPRER